MLVILCNYFKRFFITAFVGGSERGQFNTGHHIIRLFIGLLVQNLPRRQRGYIEPARKSKGSGTYVLFVVIVGKITVKR